MVEVDVPEERPVTRPSVHRYPVSLPRCRRGRGSHLGTPTGSLEGPISLSLGSTPTLVLGRVVPTPGRRKPVAAPPRVQPEGWSRFGRGNVPGSILRGERPRSGPTHEESPRPKSRLSLTEVTRSTTDPTPHSSSSRTPKTDADEWCRSLVPPRRSDRGGERGDTRPETRSSKTPLCE